MKEKIRKNMKKILSLLLAAALVLAGAGGTLHTAQAADTRTVTVSYEQMNYGESGVMGSYTIEVDGGGSLQAYCLEAETTSPTYSSVTATVTVYECTDEYVRAALYYGYEGPEEISDQTEYGTHQVASYFFSGETTLSLYSEKVEGAGGTALYEYVLENCASVPDEFHVYYCYPSGESYQAIGWWEYTPTGYLDIKKASSDEDVTDGNSFYSLEETVYTVYTDAACGTAATDVSGSRAVLTLDASGETDAIELYIGTYYVKETASGEGYELDDTIYTVTVTEDDTVWAGGGCVYDDYKGISIDLLLQKKDADSGESEGLSGAVYKIAWSRTASGDAVRTWYFTTDENGQIYLNEEYFAAGYSSSGLFTDEDGDAVIPYGYLTVQEITAPEGYTLDTGVYHVTVTSSTGNLSEESESFEIVLSSTSGFAYHHETAIKGGAVFLKTDAQADDGASQGDATLKGAEITITNASGSAVYISPSYVGADPDGEGGVSILADANGDGWYEDGEDVCVVYTDEEGYATTDGAGDGTSYVLPYGTYTARETKAPTGYLLNSDWTVTFTIAYDGYIVDTTVALEESAMRGGAVFLKVDSATGTSSSGSSSATLKGAEITIYNASAGTVYVNGAWYAPGEAVMSIYTDEDGYASTGEGVLPYGTYTAIETQASKGYELNDEWSVTFAISEDGQMADLTDQPLEEDLIRGDFCLTKKDYSAGPMEGVLFKVTNTSTGESHYLVTDENGYFTSSWSYASHTASNANKNDEAVTEDEDGNVVSVDESLLGSAYGIWFGGTDPDTSLCALPAGTYTIEEIETSVNEGYTMRSFSFVIAEADTTADDDTAGAEQALTELGTVYNTKMYISTQVSNGGYDDDSSQFFYAGEDNYIKDEVTITNTDPDSGTYTIKAVLVYGENTTDKDGTVHEAGDIYTDASGDTYEESMTFIASSTSLSKTIEFDSVDLTGMEGSTLVVFTYVYDADGELLLEAEDLTDRDETLYIAGIETEALDTENGTHMSDTDSFVTITDTVSYSNIYWGKSYTMIGVLYYDDGTQVLCDDGQPVTAKATFTANALCGAERTYEKDGSVSVAHGTRTLTFTLDSSLLGGKTIVAYVYLCYSSSLTEDDGTYTGLMASGTDPDDEDESIHFAAISTHAADGLTGDNVGAAGAQTSIIDTVLFEDLVPGYTYKLSASVYDEDGKETSYSADTVFTVGSDETITLSSNDTDESGAVTSMKADGKSADGYVTVTIGDVEADQGDTYTVYETLYIKGTGGSWYEIGEHADADDEDQTVHYPEISTLAYDTSTADDVGALTTSAKIQDRVYFENVVPEETYTVTGTLYDRSTGEVLEIDGQTFTVTRTFTVSGNGQVTVSGSESGSVTSMDEDGKSADGYITVTFTGIDSETLAGDTVVVYETLMHNTVAVAEHKEQYDDEETIHYPYIDTEAYDIYTGDHVGTVFGSLVASIRTILGDEDVDGDGITDTVQENLIDTVTLKDLAPGRTYTLTGTLYDADSGSVCTQGDSTLTQSVTFTVSDNGKNISIVSGEADSAKVDRYDAATNGTDATIVLAFSVDTSMLEGRTLVVYETLFHNGVAVATHSEIDDAGQSVYYPEIKTHAVDSGTLDHVGTSSEEAVIEDTVFLSDLVAGEEYSVSGYVVYAEDYTDADGAGYSAGDKVDLLDSSMSETTFTATSEEQEVTLTYAIDSTLLKGTTVVVCEEVYHEGVMVITHNDITSEEQSVYYPAVGTDAADGDTYDDVGSYTEGGTIVDTVTLTNLMAGMTYTLKGILMDADSGEELGYTKTITVSVSEDGSVAVTGGEEVISAATGTGRGVNAQVTLTFTGINTTTLADHTAVAFEYLYHEHTDCAQCWTTKDGSGDVLIACHTDILDEEQSVHYPSMDTVATDRYTGDHVGTVWGSLISSIRSLLGLKDADGNGIADAVQENLIETVSLTNLVPGRTYTITGTLVNNITGEAAELDGSKMAQTYSFTVSEDGSALVFEGDEPENSETLNADVDKNRVDAEVTFAFSVDTSQMAGKSLVVYEELTHNGAVVAQLKDKDDADETVSYPEIKTNAVDLKTNDHVGTSSQTAVIEDTVFLSDLVVGEEYTVSGYVVYAEDYTDADGAGRSAGDKVALGSSSDTEVTFTATSKEAELTLMYEVDSTLLKGTTVVVFEEVYHEGVMVIAHDDITSSEQSIYYPSIDTEVCDSCTGGHAGTIYGKLINGIRSLFGYDTDEETLQTITDTVSLTNLVAGKTYTAIGVLMDKSTGEELIIDGGNVTQTVTFTVSSDGQSITTDEDYAGSVVIAEYDPEAGSADVRIDMIYTFDSSLLGNEAKTIVVFETLYYSDTAIAEHCDIEDKDQSIYEVSVETEALDALTLSHEGTLSESAQITDTVYMDGLIRGEEYTVTGYLVIADDTDPGETVYITDTSEERISLSVTFTASEDDGAFVMYEEISEEDVCAGYIQLSFSFDSTQAKGKTVAVIEEVSYNGAVISMHGYSIDENGELSPDASQCVYYPEAAQEASGGVSPSTGDGIGLLLWMIISLAAVLGITMSLMIACGKRSW